MTRNADNCAKAILAMLTALILLSGFAAAEKIVYASEHNGYVDVESSYSNATDSIATKICGFDSAGNPKNLNVHYGVIDSSTQAQLRDSIISGRECFSDSVRARSGKFMVIVDDLSAPGQFFREIEAAAPQGLSCNERGGAICSLQESCSGKLLPGSNLQVCCEGACEPNALPVLVAENIPNPNDFSQGLKGAVVIAGLLVIVALMVFGMKFVSGDNDAV
ncbi:MAG TPA: hypothetical protein VJH23_06620 [archaeon]|nr:hypothetical protein [archaeon]